MNKKLEPCPFCGGEVRIIVCDDEGNHHAPDYKDDPWSGLGFMLYHDEESNPDCPIAHEVWRQFGRTIYDTREEATDAWNRRAATEANEALTLEELRGMDGEPVYMVDLTGGTLWTQWMIFERHTDKGFVPRGGGWFGADTYGKTWLAYRRRPEGGEW